MKPEEIIELAKKAGFWHGRIANGAFLCSQTDLERFAALHREALIESGELVPREKVEADEKDALHMIVAGAIYDFAAYLTTRKTSMPVGEKELCGPMVDAIKEWAIARNLPLNNAAVLSWQEAIDRARSEP